MRVDITQLIADNITSIRKKQGKTQDEVAKLLGVSRVSYSGLESGNKDISISCLVSLSAIFGISLEQLVHPDRDETKYEQMIFYILSFFKKGGITKTKLAKLTYLSDFYSFYLKRKSISGVAYINRPYGPVADIFLDLIDELWDKGKIRVQNLSEGAIMIFSSSFSENFDLLSESERRIIKSVCEAWKDKPTREIVNYTHEQKPWALTKQGDYISYELILEEKKEHIFQPL